MPFPASDSEMGILRHEKDKSAKAKRGGKKAAAASSNATPKRKRRRVGGDAATPAPAASAAGESTPANTALPGAGAHRDVAPPPLSTTPAGATSDPRLDHGPTGPALPGVVNATTGERRRWPERKGPATTHGDAKRKGSDSRGDSGDTDEPPPRANKLVPTNAVHLTERRIKRRLHKNGAFMAAAAAALLGVLILTNQSEPPELVFNERQIASRLPAAQDWQSDATSETLSEAATRGPEAKVGASFGEGAASETSTVERKHASVQFRTPASPGAPGASQSELSAGDIFEMQRILARLDLAPGEPNGVLGDETIDAIRLYQQMAGMPVDGEASQALLADMREVANILAGNN